jgi:hydroxymethylglutaryl-CoA lyase
MPFRPSVSVFHTLLIGPKSHICRSCRSRPFSSTRTYNADYVRIVEVGPRDGLQNEKNTIPLSTKLELINRLAGTGITHLEAGSFVPAKWVPQMDSTAQILETILDSPPPTKMGNAGKAASGVAYNYLVPNIRGLQNMVKILQERGKKGGVVDEGYESGTEEQKRGQGPSTSTMDANEMGGQPPVSGAVKNTSEISLFAAATETFSHKNTNCSIAESMERCKPIMELAKENDIRVRGYVSVALGCPYEGPDVDPHKVAELTATLLEMGCDEVSVADTTGMGTAPKTRRLLQTLKEAGILNEDLALHFHDTFGMALVNTVVGLEHGVRIFDSSVGGLGGCPYSKGATGNVSTEDLLHLLHSLGCETGVDLPKVAQIGRWITGQLGKANESRAGKATLARLEL